MQLSILAAIAAFPALFSAVMAAVTSVQCAEGGVATGGPLPCNKWDDKLKACKSGDTTNLMGADCIKTFIGAITIGAASAGTTVTEEDFIAILNAGLDLAVKQPSFLAKPKSKTGSLSAGSFKNLEPVADAFDGITDKEFQAIPAAVLKEIKPDNIATLNNKFFNNLSKDQAGGFTDDQYKKVTDGQAKEWGVAAPTDAEAIKKGKTDSACAGVKDKYKKFSEAAEKALTERCKWANSASAVSVTMFLTAAAMMSVFVMNSLAF